MKVVRDSVHAEPLSVMSLPEWLSQWVDIDGRQLVSDPDSPIQIETASNDHFALVSLVARNARELDAAQFEQLSLQTFNTLRRALCQTGPFQPVRIWNYIPDILRDSGDDLDRYMIFNRARYNAFDQWFSEDDIAQLPAGTGVGHGQDELAIHCLASLNGAAAVENPRQRPAHQYSQRYGPRPPMFSRAITLKQPGHSTPSVLVGGTASVVGEDTSHLDDTQAQLDETLLNLAALVSHAVGSDDDQESLGRFREVRAYYPQDELPAEQVEHLAARMPNATRIDWIQADLCRRNLLVEIEGIAEA